MSNWTPVWHQAMTRILFDGKMVGRKKTAGFTFPIYVNGTAVRVRLSNRFGKEAAVIGSLTFVYKHQVYDLTYNGENPSGFRQENRSLRMRSTFMLKKPVKRRSASIMKTASLTAI